MDVKEPGWPARLAAERQRRLSAEAEVTELRAQLDHIAAAAESNRALPDAMRELARVVAQLRERERELEDQRDLVRQVINTSPNLVYVEADNGEIVLTNRSNARILSWTSSRSRPEPGPDAAPGPAPAETSDEPAETTSFEECYQLMNGETRWYHTTQSPLLRSDGSRYLLTFSSDITDLKRATRLAEESAQAKQVFMANMSHEIRTPLHGVMGLAELLMKGSLAPEQADYVEMIQSSTENLLVVINDILDFAKIETGNITLEKIPFDLMKTVHEAIRSLAFIANEKGALLRVVAPPEPLPLAFGDPHRLRQVLINLISNAIKFTKRGAITIGIDASARAGLALPVTFSVADTGVGISPENLEHVFDSFRQADGSVARLYGGTGLGLAICKNLVELQGGSIGVRSELGQGSCFFFTIPYAVSNQPLLREAAEAPAPDLLRGLRILFVEDNAINQLIAVSMLNQWHVQVDMAQNGEEAVAKAQQRAYDLVLMDIQMPQMNGIEATARLRAADSLNRRTPIVALTADAMRLNADTRQALGFTDFLTKPYSERALYRVVARASGRAARAQQPAEVTLAPADLGLHYDFELLGKLADDPGFVRKMLELFIGRVPGQVQALHEAAEREEWETVANEAHALKSTFGMLNIRPEVASLKMVEELAGLRAPKSEMLPFVAAVAKGAQLFAAIFAEELAKLPPASGQ